LNSSADKVAFFALENHQSRISVRTIRHCNAGRPQTPEPKVAALKYFSTQIIAVFVFFFILEEIPNRSFDQ